MFFQAKQKASHNASLLGRKKHDQSSKERNVGISSLVRMMFFRGKLLLLAIPVQSH